MKKHKLPKYEDGHYVYSFDDRVFLWKKVCRENIQYIIFPVYLDIMPQGDSKPTKKQMQKGMLDFSDVFLQSMKDHLPEDDPALEDFAYKYICPLYEESGDISSDCEYDEFGDDTVVINQMKHGKELVDVALRFISWVHTVPCLYTNKNTRMLHWILWSEEDMQDFREQNIYINDYLDFGEIPSVYRNSY